MVPPERHCAAAAPVDKERPEILHSRIQGFRFQLQQLERS